MNFEICIINPDKTKVLNKKIEECALKIINKETKILINKNQIDENSFSGYYDESVNVTNLIKEIEINTSSDAFIITCFEDSGLDIARTVTSKPVLGIGESSFHLANIISKKFSIITTLSRSNEAIKNNLLRYDLNNKCVSLKAIEVPILDLETMSNINILKLRNEIERTLTEDKPEALIICGLGMLKLSKQLQDEYEIPVIEGVSSAITMAESLIKLGFKINKLGLKHSMSQRYNGNLSEFINKE